VKTGFCVLTVDRVAGFCEHDNETWPPIKDEEFVDYLSDHRFVKKGSAQ
jgi:hypothetical protein